MYWFGKSVKAVTILSAELKQKVETDNKRTVRAVDLVNIKKGIHEILQDIQSNCSNESEEFYIDSLKQINIIPGSEYKERVWK